MSTTKHNVIWGVNNLSHQASLSVYKNYEVPFSSLGERFSKVKNDRNLNSQIFEYALNYGEPSKVVFCGIPWKKTLESALYKNFRIYRKKQQTNKFSFLKNIKHEFIDHHTCHAANSWFGSPFDRGCVLSVDGYGDLATVSIWHADGSSFKCIWKAFYPHSLGLFYSFFTKELGFKPNEEEFYLMGLSQFGEPRYFDYLLNHFFMKGEFLISKKNCHLHSPLGIDYSKKDMAASVQKVYEFLFERLLLKVSQMTKEKNLCLAGGSVLNCIANKLSYKFFDNCYIPPAPGDGGNSLGALLWDQKKKIELGSGYLGYDLGYNINIDKTLDLIKSQGLVALAQGKAELGPRALGNRSILADISNKDAIDKITNLKNRAYFRPFSPVVLIDDYKKYFSGPMADSNLMHHTVEVRSKYKKIFKFVSGPNGFSRVQTVSKKNNINLYNILTQWKKISGHGILLNTSLNTRGRPIINDEYDLKHFKNEYDIPVVCGKR